MDYPERPVMVVDDEAQVLIAFSTELRLGGITNVVTCEDPRKVLPMLAQQEPEVLLLDLFMPHISGQELLAQVVNHYPEIPVIIVTAASEISTAVECIKKGAYDYLAKPMEEGRLVTTVIRAISHREMQREIISLRERVLSGSLKHPEAFSESITNNSAMFSIFQYIETVARTSQPLLITGETGVGKELIAHTTHSVSGRQGEFVHVNVAGLDDGLFSDTLFGHSRGAFTGADRDRGGLVERATGGTLFLDEIGDLNPLSQVKLLHLLHEGEYLPLGQDIPMKTDTRVIVATNSDLLGECEAGRFRKDLFYRLQTHHVHLPPLRDRLDDLPVLVEHFLKEAATELNKKKPTLPKEIFQLLGAYYFPGNIRELKAMVFDAVSRHTAGVLSLDSFKEHISQTGATPLGSKEFDSLEKTLFSGIEKLPTLQESNQQLLKEAVRRSDGNITVAAKILGISRQALSRRLKNNPK